MNASECVRGRQVEGSGMSTHVSKAFYVLTNPEYGGTGRLLSIEHSGTMALMIPK